MKKLMLSLILLITGNIAHGMCCWKAQPVAPAPAVQSPTITVGLSMAEREQLARDLTTRYPATQLAVARIEIANARRQNAAKIQQILEEKRKYSASMAIVDGAHRDSSQKQLAQHRSQRTQSQH